MRRVLIIAAKANMIQQFNLRNIEILLQKGAEVHVATDFQEFGSMDGSENRNLINYLEAHSVIAHQVDFKRGVGSILSNLQTIQELRNIIKKYSSWDLVHVHSPIGAALGRLAVKSVRKQIPVLYTAHGFHFFKGAPLKNWLFYPIEWLLSFITDQLLVINKADFTLAKTMPIKNVHYLPSVGADVQNALSVSKKQRYADRQQIRLELGLSDADYVIINVGELSSRKNQMAILKALTHISDKSVKLIVAGVGNQLAEYSKFVVDHSLSDRVLFLGYRNDLRKLHHASDLMIFPSLREGFGLGGFDALVDGLYVIGTRNTGMADYIINSELGVLIDSKNENKIIQAILDAKSKNIRPNLLNNEEHLLTFDFSNVDKLMLDIYEGYIGV